MAIKEKNYIKTQLKTNIEINSIYTIHYFRYGKNFNFKNEKHPFWELIYIDSGMAIIFADGKEITLNQGEAYLYKPNELHSIKTLNSFANSAIISFDCKSRFLYLLTEKIICLNNEEKGYLNKIINEFKLGYDDKLNDLHLLKLTKKSTQPFGSDQIIKNFIELLLISLLRPEQNKDLLLTKNSSKDFSSFVNTVIKIMNEKLEKAENISLDEISKKTGYSKSYIKSKFKQETGQSTLQYYIKLKIEKAKILLSHDANSISEISDILGFSCVPYFCKQFKLHTDMSPKEYVNSIKAENLL